MLWLLIAADAVAGVYLLGWALRRERRDKPGVLAVGVVLLLCAAVIAGLAVIRATAEPPPQPPVSPGGPLVRVLTASA